MKVTKQFLASIKKADSVVFRFRGDNGVSTIDLFFRDRDSSESVIMTFETDNTAHLTGIWHTFLYPSMDNTSTTTIISLLKVNDQIDFSVDDYSSEALRDCGFTSDTMIIRITRYRKDEKTISKRMFFIWDNETTRGKRSIEPRMLHAVTG